ncbi:MAG: NAD(P)-dependent oxidoreductase [Gammaproteobacteria bacterium]|nr:NAD(P)-dependent oxidoreductase [Gammaproteobacteria bacterium]
MNIERICLLGLGEVGRTLAEDLLRGSAVELQVWDAQLDRADSAAAKNYQALAALAAVQDTRLQRASSGASAALNCQLVLSAVTADQAINAARAILPGLADNTWFVDLNSVSPVTKQQLSHAVEKVGGRFVEAAIMSPIGPQRSAAPMLLAGPQASDFEILGRDLGFSAMRAVSPSLGVAAATKMCRSVIIKGMEALVTESLLAARYYGVDGAVLESLNDLFPRPDWSQHAQYLISRSLQHGGRRAAEMREVAKTVHEAGLTPWMSEGCVERQAWAAQFHSLLQEPTLGGMLDAMQAQLDQHNNPHE